MSAQNPDTPLTRLHKTIASFRHAHGNKVLLFLSVTGIHRHREHLNRTRILVRPAARAIKSFHADTLARFAYHEDFKYTLEGVILGTEVRRVDVDALVRGVLSK